MPQTTCDIIKELILFNYYYNHREHPIYELRRRRNEATKKSLTFDSSSPSGNNSFLVLFFFLHILFLLLFSPEDETLPYETVFLTLLTHSPCETLFLYFSFSVSNCKLLWRQNFLYSHFYLFVLDLTRTWVGETEKRVREGN